MHLSINLRKLSMPTAGRLSDKGTQHDGYYETVIIAGSPTVSIDGLPAGQNWRPLTAVAWSSVAARSI